MDSGPNLLGLAASCSLDGTGLNECIMMSHYRRCLEAALGGEAFSHISENGIVVPDYSDTVKEVDADRISYCDPLPHALQSRASFGNIPVFMNKLCFYSFYVSLKMSAFAHLRWLRFKL